MSGIYNAKKGMGWLNPNVRPACGNCDQVKVEQPLCVNCKPAMRCGPGGFLTSRFAICDRYTPMMLTGGSVPR